MTHKLTKFQNECWKKIKPHLVEGHDTQITFDDELQISFGIENGKVTIEIFPKEEILLFVKFDDGSFEKQLFFLNNLDYLIEIIDKNEFQ
jgi:hypothetical protein